MTEVQIVRRKNGLVLVQWRDAKVSKRAWVLGEMVVENEGEAAQVEQPEQGVPESVDWHRLIKLEAVTAKDIDAELKRRNIWTVADLRARPNEALAAIQTVFGVTLATLLQAADQYDTLQEVVNG